jgi:hypothetical protein
MRIIGLKRDKIIPRATVQAILDSASRSTSQSALQLALQSVLDTGNPQLIPKDLDSNSSAKSANPSQLRVPRIDEIDLVISGVLTPYLKTAANNSKLQKDHPCFDKAREFAQKWKISDQAVANLFKSFKAMNDLLCFLT